MREPVRRPTKTMAHSGPGHPKVLRSLLAAVVLLGGGAAVAWLLIELKAEPARREVAAYAPVVESVVLEAGAVTERFVGYGTAQPHRITNLGAEVAGRVVEVVGRLRAGSVVTASQALVRIDDREYAQLLKRAEALAAADQAAVDGLDAETEKLAALIDTARQEERVARNEYMRVTDLFERQLAAKKEYDFANLAYQQVRRVLQAYQMEESKLGPRRRQLLASKDAHLAEVAQAQLNIDRCSIAAPFAGAIKALNVEVGDWVGPGSIVATVLDTARVEIGLQLPAAVYDRTAAGAPCSVKSESMPDVEWHGRVARVAPSVDEQTRTFSAYVEVDNTQQNLPCIPGTFVRAEVQGPTHADALAVPRGAIRDDLVFVAMDGVARTRAVHVGCFVADRVLVTGDVAAGDRVILSHLSQLRDGSAIRLQAEEQAPAKAASSAASGGRSVLP